MGSVESTPRFAALQYRDFRLIWLGQGISATGTQVQRVAVAWQVYELTHSPVALGLIALCRGLPIIGLGLFTGVVADAFDRRRLMMLTQMLLATSSTLLAILTFTHHITPAAIYGLTFLSGCSQAFDSPARQAIVFALVPREVVANAFGLYGTVLKLASVLGPALGGLILEGAGVGMAYVLDATSFLAVIGALLIMKHRHVPPPSSRVNAAAALEGLRFIRSQPILVWLTTLDFVGSFFAGSTQLMPIFADTILHVGKRGLGLLLGAPALGSVIAAAVVSALPEIRRRGPTMLVCVGIYGAATAAFGLSRMFALSLGLLAIAGAADIISTIIRGTVRNLVTPDALRGRLSAVSIIFSVGGPQLGEFEAGAVAQLIGAPWSVATGGIACALVALGVAVLVPTVRESRA